MNIQLSDHFNYKKLFRFVISPILMMMFTSLYSIVDGIFVSNFVGKTPFSAINLIMPVIMCGSAFGFMIGTGGSAVVSKALGEGKAKQANQYFSLLVCICIVISIIISSLGFIFIEPISKALGATGELLDNCILYGKILFISQPFFILQNVFQSFFSTSGKPDLSLKLSIMCGLTNIVLDFLFIVVLHWGIAGAAIATAVGEILGGIIPVIYFLSKNSSLLRLVKPIFDSKVILKTFTNGSSEMVTNLSVSIVSVFYNFQLMKFAGENGVAAYGVIMYVNFIFMAVYIGYSIASAPIIGYNYGAKNYKELKNLFKKSIVIMSVSGILLTILAQILNIPFVTIFAGYDHELFEMTSLGFRLYAISFLFMGINVFGSAFFTALNNGLVSAVISFLRTFVFQIAAVFVIPLLFGINGIWLSVVIAELLALIVTIVFFAANKKRYHYI